MMTDNVGKLRKEFEDHRVEYSHFKGRIETKLDGFDDTIKELKKIDEKILSTIEDHTKKLNTLLSSRSLGKEIMKIFLATIASGVILILAWFVSQAIAQ